MLEKEEEQNNAMVRFMHLSWPAKLFYWPENRNYGQEDASACLVPFVNILCIVDIPEIQTYTGRI